MSRGPLYPRATRAPRPASLREPTEAVIVWLCDRACETAHRIWSRNTARKGDLEELTSAGFLAVVQARDTHDPNTLCGFHTWASLQAGYAILEEARRQGFLTRGRHRRITELEISQGMGHALTAAEREELQLQPHERPALSLTTKLDPENEDAGTLEDAIVDPRPGPETLVVDRPGDYTPLHAAIDQADLTRQERAIVQAALAGRSFTEIGAESQPPLSANWISRLHTRAVTKLRRHLFEQGIEDL